MVQQFFLTVRAKPGDWVFPHIDRGKKLSMEEVIALTAEDSFVLNLPADLAWLIFFEDSLCAQ